MKSRNFREMLEAQWARGNFVCVGLDSEYEKIPKHLHRVADSGGRGLLPTVCDFNDTIVRETNDLVCAYKPNLAFYLALGADGLVALRKSIQYINPVAEDVPVILDAKWADIGNTNAGYVKMAFEYLGADAVTVHPYLGAEAMQPFLDCKDKGVFVLCRTSNPGAGEFQDIKIEMGPILLDGDPRYRPLYQVVVQSVAGKWNKNGNCALVVGATYPDELSKVRRIAGDMPILIPGVGAQGGDVEKTVTAGKDSRGMGMIINSSRGIIFASSGTDFAEAARRETQKLHDAINQYR